MPNEPSVCFDAVDLLEKEPLVRISLWWLRDKKKASQYSLVYGQALATRQSLSAWSTAHLGEKTFEFFDGSSRKLQLQRTSRVMPGKSVRGLFDSLGKPASLEASMEGTVDLPVGRPLNEAGRWAVLPPIVCSPLNSRIGLSTHQQGRHSLLDESSTFCTRATPSNRLFFTKGYSSVGELLRWVGGVVTQQSSVDLLGSAGDAFGCLEAFAFPAFDTTTEYPLVWFTRRRESEATDAVTIHLSPHLDEADYYAQLRSETAQDTYQDHLLTLPAGTREVTCHVPGHADGLVLRVWKRVSDSESWLFHEEERHYIREMQFNLDMMGLSGSVGAEWLKALGGSKKSDVVERADTYSQINQVSMTQPMVINHRSDWEKSVLSTREEVSNARPESSDARFFSKGWEGTSKLGLAVWLKEKLSSHRGRILLLDPYFDVPGLDLIVRCSGGASRFDVLLNSQIASQDDPQNKLDRPSRLREVCKELFPIVLGVNLRILDLRSNKGGASQLFHDRYLLFFDDKGKPTSGYNLSTSLQSATRTSPLLVTPIPRDVLSEVATYVESLTMPESTGADAHIEQLFPLPSVVRAARNEGCSAAEARSVVEVLTQLGRSTTALTVEDPRDGLRAAGALKGEGVETKVVLSFSEAELLHLGRELSSDRDQQSKALLWEGLVQCSLRDWRDGLPCQLGTLAKTDPDGLGLSLDNYLRGHMEGQLSQEGEYEFQRTLSHLATLDTEGAAVEAERLYDHHHELPIGCSWSIHLASRLLLECAPDRLDNLLLAEQPSSIGREYVRSALVSVITQAAQRGSRDNREALLAMKLPLARTLGLIAFCRAARDPAGRDDFTSILAKVARKEQLLVLSRAVHELRIEVNRGTFDEDSEEFLSFIIGLLLHRLQSTSVDEVAGLVRHWSGPLLGSHALLTHNQIVAPLVSMGAIDSFTPFELWTQVLAKRLLRNFCTDADFALVRVWGATYWQASEESARDVLNNAQKQLRAAERKLLEPWLFSRDFDAWSKVAHQILWWLLRLWAIEQSRSGSSRPETQSLLDNVRELVRREQLASRVVGQIKDASKQVLDILDRKSQQAAGEQTGTT